MKDTLLEIKAALKEFADAAEVFKSDETAAIAKRALDAAVAAKESADKEDDSIDAEEMIDRRLEADRAVDIAKLRLDRAERVRDARRVALGEILDGPAERTAALLRQAAPQVFERLQKDAKELFGESDYSFLARHVEHIAYNRGAALSEQALRIDRPTLRNPTADTRAEAIAGGLKMLESATI